MQSIDGVITMTKNIETPEWLAWKRAEAEALDLERARLAGRVLDLESDLAEAREALAAWEREHAEF